VGNEFKTGQTNILLYKETEVKTNSSTDRQPQLPLVALTVLWHWQRRLLQLEPGPGSDDLQQHLSESNKQSECLPLLWHGPCLGSNHSNIFAKGNAPLLSKRE